MGASFGFAEPELDGAAVSDDPLAGASDGESTDGEGSYDRNNADHNDGFEESETGGSGWGRHGVSITWEE